MPPRGKVLFLVYALMANWQDPLMPWMISNHFSAISPLYMEMTCVHAGRADLWRWWRTWRLEFILDPVSRESWSYITGWAPGNPAVGWMKNTFRFSMWVESLNRIYILRNLLFSAFYSFFFRSVYVNMHMSVVFSCLSVFVRLASHVLGRRRCRFWVSFTKWVHVTAWLGPCILRGET